MVKMKKITHKVSVSQHTEVVKVKVLNEPRLMETTRANICSGKNKVHALEINKTRCFVLHFRLKQQND